MPKSDYVKLVIDARILNSVTDLTKYSWPLEHVQMIITRVNGKLFSVSDLSCAYHQVPLSTEIQKLTSFIIGGRQYTYTRGFYALCGLPKFFSRLMTIHFELLNKKKQAITYIDDTIMQSQKKRNVLDHPRVPQFTEERWSKSRSRKNLLLPQKSEIFGTRHLI